MFLFQRSGQMNASNVSLPTSAKQNLTTNILADIVCSQKTAEEGNPPPFTENFSDFTLASTKPGSSPRFQDKGQI